MMTAKIVLAPQLQDTVMKTNIFAEMTCDYPEYQHVSYFGGYPKYIKHKLEAKVRYDCPRGYTTKTKTATCTEKGWEPKPLCTGMYKFLRNKQFINLCILGG